MDIKTLVTWVCSNPGAVIRCFERLYDELMAAKPERNPSKISMIVAENGNGNATEIPGAVAVAENDVFTNILGAVTADRHSGGKIISVNDFTGTIAGKVVVFDPAGGLVRCVDAEPVTALRCALMAALAIWCHRCLAPPAQSTASRDFTAWPLLRVGLIGTGRINAVTAAVLRVLGRYYGETEVRLTVMGSPRNPTKNIELFGLNITQAQSLADFAGCDVLITATNPYANEMISVDDLPAIPLIISQDCGYYLNETFRLTRPSFTDNAYQFCDHLYDEFARDSEEARLEVLRGVMPFTDLSFYDAKNPVVYLFGIGLADIVTALEAPQLETLR